MGLLRFLFALAVLITHSNPLLGLKLIPGNIAVESFFIISGFYMSMIITEKYSKVVNGYKLFITNRLLRIYPLYWLVLLLSVGYSVVMIVHFKRFDMLSIYINHWHDFTLGTRVWLIFTNLAIIGLDTHLFMQINRGGALQFASNFRGTSFKIYGLDFVPQAWTLSLELFFYVLSPLFVKLKNNWLAAILFLIFAIRVIAWQQGYNYDPWTNRFFPFELMWFLAGILSYRFYKNLLLRQVDTKWCYATLGFVILLTLFFSDFGSSPLAGLAYLVVIAFSIPFIFLISKKSKWDRWIGEFSYLFYISHILFLKITQTLMLKLRLSAQWESAFAFVLTFIFCWILLSVIGKRLEKYRAKRVTEQVHTTNPALA